MISITDIIKIWEFFEKRFRKPKPDLSTAEKATQPNEVLALVDRFIKIFKSHGIERTQIPRFIGDAHNLSLADLADDEQLLKRLDESLLNYTCNKFGINRVWLDGSDSEIYPQHDFYKQPEEFLNFVESLAEKNPDGQIQGVLIVPSKVKWPANALIILQETIDHLDDKTIYRYHLCNNWVFSYWKARAYLTACIAIAWKRNIYIHGITKLKENIDELASGETLLGWNGKGIWGLGHTSWYPEDMTLKPEEFLKGVAPEKDKFGLKAALGLWLELEEQGYMDSGISSSTRDKFITELQKY